MLWQPVVSISVSWGTTASCRYTRRRSKTCTSLCATTSKMMSFSSISNWTYIRWGLEIKIHSSSIWWDSLVHPSIVAIVMKRGEAESTKPCPTSSQISLEKFSRQARSSRLTPRPSMMAPILIRKRKRMVQLEFTRASSCARRSKNKARSANVIARPRFQASRPEVLAVVPLQLIARRKEGLAKDPRQKTRSNWWMWSTTCAMTCSYVIKSSKSSGLTSKKFNSRMTTLRENWGRLSSKKSPLIPNFPRSSLWRSST